MTRLEELIALYSRPLTIDPCDELRIDADTALETAEYLKKLYKPYESKKKLPCTCGRKRIELWCSTDPENRHLLVCPACGKQAGGRTEIAAIRAWNKMIAEETNGKMTILRRRAYERVRQGYQRAGRNSFLLSSLYEYLQF